MFETFQNIKNNLIVGALVSLALGLVLLIFPDTFLNVACYVLGAVLIAYAVICIIGCIRDNWMRIGTMVFGVILVAVGIFIISNPRMIGSIIPLVVGLMMLIDGVVNVRHGIGLRAFGDSSGTAALILGIITVALGALILMNPYSTATLTFRLIGVSLIYNGVSDLIILFRMNRANHQYKKQQEVIDVEARPVRDDEEDNT